VSEHHTRPKDEQRPRREKKASERTSEKEAEQEDAIARVTATGLHIVEDLIYVFTALLLVAGAVVVLVQAGYRLAIETPEGVTHALEDTLDSLLIVFILVELLSAVRTAIDEHFLVAEPFLLVGILASIKEIVVLATFRIDEGKPSDIALKIGVLGGIVVALGVATYILRRREREPEEVGDSPSDQSE
jgi:uncharacterized membrane protein (DUF373 family)